MKKLRVIAFAVSLVASLATATAGTLVVSASGQFDANVTADQLAAPNQIWSFSFTVDSTPAATNTDTLGFDVPFGAFLYTLNGSPVSLVPQSIRFETAGDLGLFTLYFGPESGFLNGVAIPELSLEGSQAFTGSTTNPVITPGVYSISTLTYSDAANYDVLAGGTASITPTPEPATGWLVFPVILLLAARWSKRVLSTSASR